MREYTPTSCLRPTSGLGQALAEHEGLVHWVVQRQWLGELPYAEALHRGRIALWRALRGYDPRRGCAFSTYAVPAIQRAVWHAVDQAQPNPREVLTPHPHRPPEPPILGGTGTPPGNSPQNWGGRLETPPRIGGPGGSMDR